MSIFALNITPYITSSIIIQLLTIAIPKLEEMQRDGEEGRKKMTAITRYLTIGLSLFQSVAMTIGFGNKGLIPDMNFGKAVVVVTCLTAGSALLMWIGEQITDKGVGNGISIVLMINIVSRIPSDMVTLFDQFVKGKTYAKGALAAVIIAAVILVVVVFEHPPCGLRHGHARRYGGQDCHRAAGPGPCRGGHRQRVPLS